MIIVTVVGGCQFIYDKTMIYHQTFLGMDMKKGAMDKETFRKLMER